MPYSTVRGFLHFLQYLASQIFKNNRCLINFLLNCSLLYENTKMVIFLEICRFTKLMLVYKGHLCIADEQTSSKLKNKPENLWAIRIARDFLSLYHLSCDSYLPMVWLSCALLFAHICHSGLTYYWFPFYSINAGKQQCELPWLWFFPQIIENKLQLDFGNCI